MLLRGSSRRSIGCSQRWCRPDRQAIRGFEQQGSERAGSRALQLADWLRRSSGGRRGRADAGQPGELICTGQHGGPFGSESRISTRHTRRSCQRVGNAISRSAWVSASDLSWSISSSLRSRRRSTICTRRRSSPPSATTGGCPAACASHFTTSQINSGLTSCLNCRMAYRCCLTPPQGACHSRVTC